MGSHERWHWCGRRGGVRISGLLLVVLQNPPGMSLAADRFEPSRLVPFGDQPDMDPDDRSDEGGGGQVPGPGRQGARGVAAGPAETDSTE